MTDRSPKRRRLIWERTALALLALGALVGALVALQAARAGRLAPTDLATVLIGCIVIGIGAAGVAVTYSPGDIPRSPRLDRWKRAQQNRSLNLLGQICIGPLLMTGWIRSAIENMSTGDHWWAALYLILVVGVACSPSMVLMGWTYTEEADRPYLDEELDRSFRAKALATGFWALLAAGGIAWVLALTAPATVAYLLPFTLWFGGAAASSHFIWQHHRAQPADDDDA